MTQAPRSHAIILMEEPLEAVADSEDRKTETHDLAPYEVWTEWR